LRRGIGVLRKIFKPAWQITIPCTGLSLLCDCFGGVLTSYEIDSLINEGGSKDN